MNGRHAYVEASFISWILSWRCSGASGCDSGSLYLRHWISRWPLDVTKTTVLTKQSMHSVCKTHADQLNHLHADSWPQDERWFFAARFTTQCSQLQMERVPTWQSVATPNQAATTGKQYAGEYLSVSFVPATTQMLSGTRNKFVTVARWPCWLATNGLSDTIVWHDVAEFLLRKPYLGYHTGTQCRISGIR